MMDAHRLFVRKWTVGVFLCGFVLCVYIFSSYRHTPRASFYPKEKDRNNTSIVAISDSIGFHELVSKALANEKASKAEVASCLQKWAELKRLPGSEIIFYGMGKDVEKECGNCILGNPFQPLPQFRSPCWVSRLTSSKPHHFTLHPSMQHRFDKLKKLYPLRLANSSSGVTWRMRCLPLVIIGGFTKSGTTDLHNTLSTYHPRLRSNSWKEGHYWNDLRLGYDGPGMDMLSLLGREAVNFVDYLDMLGPAAEHTLNDRQANIYSNLVVDSTPSYIWRFPLKHLQQYLSHNESMTEYVMAHTVQKFVPGMKTILLLREPAARAYSGCKYYWKTCDPETFHKTALKVTSGFRQCVKKGTLRGCAYSLNVQQEYFLFLPSLYFVYIHDWLNVFDRTQFLFIKSEDYYASRPPVISDVCSFLEVDDLPSEVYSSINQTRVHNKSRRSGALPMLPETKKLLKEFFAPYNAMLADLLRDDKFMWL